MNFISSAAPLSQTNEAFWFIFKDNYLLIRDGQCGSSVSIITGSQPADIDLSFVNFFGVFDNNNCFAGILTSDSIPAGYQLKELRLLHGLLNEDIYIIACKAFEIVHWDKTHQFCSQCGSEMAKSGVDFSKICPSCNFQNYPRISPAIIVAITNDDKILLARHPGSDIFSVIAGYVEIGETLEDAVKRESMEEVNIEIKNVKYYTSQPWVFSHALMIAYTAEYYKGELKPDGKEIEEAGWFRASELPSGLPRPLSVSRKLIDWFINRSTR